MRIFAIGDLHLEGGTGKTMERFGENWRNHDEKIFQAWEQLGRDDDVLLIVGDSSWALRLHEAQPDLDRIGRMKGLKLLFKGNHDYWWQSVAKMAAVLHPSINIMQGNSLIINRVAIAGTRGWLCPNDAYFEPADEKIYQREVQRLKTALDSLQEHQADFDFLIVALHYPPTNMLHHSSGFTDLMDAHQANACVYGHLHGESIKTALTGWRGTTFHYLVSADAVDFAPAEIDLSRKKA
ncbi:MAG: metallophosphoesterase [Acidobacteria bacterium]|nr:metallophosphoesterase [Acidobacteriota bacterium]